jgi:hypothetical protein
MNGTDGMSVPPPPQPASSQAIAALILAILGLVTCQLLSPFAWYLGRQEARAIREGRAPAAGLSLANVSVILGMVGTFLFLAIMIWMLFLGGMAVVLAFFHH